MAGLPLPAPAPDDRAVPAELVDVLVQVSFTTVAALTRIGAEHDLSLTQLRLLGILRDRRCGMSGLADFLGLEKSTVTGLVDRAEKRGLVQRVPHPDDRRAVEVTLSEAAHALFDQLYPRVLAVLTPGLAELSPSEQTQLYVLLGRVAPATPEAPVSGVGAASVRSAG